MDTFSGNGDFVTETRSAKELWASIWKRFLELAIKLVSVKGFCLALATAALCFKFIDGWMWLAVVGLVVGGKLGEKLVGR